MRVGVGLLGRRLLLQRQRPYQTLIERWDGTSWAIVSSPNTSATQTNFLYGVTCVSASDCWAVGANVSSGVHQTLIERWDGTSWAIVTSPNTSATEHNYLYGVTCVSASDCWAVGYYNSEINNSNIARQTLIERWDGTSWAIVTSPNTSTTQDNVLFGVTCVGVGLLGRRLLRSTGTSLSDAHRAVGRDLVDHRHLAQPQRRKTTHPHCGDVRVGVRLLGRRLLRRRGTRSTHPDPHRAVGRDLVGHRHLAQHQHHADQLPLWRDVRVGVRVLGRRLLLHAAAPIRP